RLRRCDVEEADHRDRSLLSVRRMGPYSRRAADKREEIASPHSQPQGSEQGIVAGQTGRLEVDKTALGNGSFGLKADIGRDQLNVRFTPESRRRWTCLNRYADWRVIPRARYLA